MWRNFSFPCMTIVWKLKISPHVRKIEPQSTFVDKKWQIWGLRITFVQNIVKGTSALNILNNNNKPHLTQVSHRQKNGKFLYFQEFAEHLFEKLFFAQYHSRSSLESCSNAPIFRASFPRRVGGGTNWRKVFKRSETDSKLRIWLTYFGPNRSKVWESFFWRKWIEIEIL